MVNLSSSSNGSGKSENSNVQKFKNWQTQTAFELSPSTHESEANIIVNEFFQSNTMSSLEEDKLESDV